MSFHHQYMPPIPWIFFEPFIVNTSAFGSFLQPSRPPTPHPLLDAIGDDAFDRLLLPMLLPLQALDLLLLLTGSLAHPSTLILTGKETPKNTWI